MPDSPVTHCQRLKAGMDRNGNTRAIWMCYFADGSLSHVIVEYSGKPISVYSKITLPEINVTRNEMKAFIIIADRNGNLYHDNGKGS